MSPMCQRATSIVLALVLLVALAACTGGGQGPTFNRDGATTMPVDDPDLVVQQSIDCPAASGQPAADGWSWTAYVSVGAGLVVRDLRFGPRMVARSLSVPSIALASGDSSQTTLDRVPGSVGHLTVLPRTTDPDLTSTLLGEPECNPAGHAGILARYKVTSAKLHLDFVVEQDYRFDTFNPDTRCEAGKTAQCVRFWPSTYWAAIDPPGSDRVGLDITQRYELDPDGMGGGSADLTSDTPNIDLKKLSVSPEIDHHGDDGMLTHPGSTQALSKGKVLVWENWHQTDRTMVTLPGLPKYPLGPPVTKGYAGCSECVHFHWSWFGRLPSARAAQIAACGNPLCWTNGKAQILPGSKQTACLGYRSDDAAVAVDTDWCTQPADNLDEPLPADRRTVVYWESRSTGATSPSDGVNIDGTQYPYGDGLWPQRPNGDKIKGNYPGDTGAMFLVPARSLDRVGRDTKPNHEQAVLEFEDGYHTDGGSRLAAGWVVPIALTLKKGNRGPFYLRVRTGSRVRWRQAPDSPVPTTNPGGPWVNLYDDRSPTADPNATSRRLEVGDGTTRYAYVVLDKEPGPGDLEVNLDAAPDGIAGYQASVGLPAAAGGDELAGDWAGTLTSNPGKGKKSLEVAVELSESRGVATGQALQPLRGCGAALTETGRDGRAVDFRTDALFGGTRCGSGKLTLTRKGKSLVYRSDSYHGTLTAENDPEPSLRPGMWSGPAKIVGAARWATSYQLEVSGEGAEREVGYDYADGTCAATMKQVLHIKGVFVFEQAGQARKKLGATCPQPGSVLVLGAETGSENWAAIHFLDDTTSAVVAELSPPLAAFVSPSGNLTCGQLEDGLTVACFVGKPTFAATCADEAPVAMSSVGPTGRGAFSGCGQGERESLPKGEKLSYGKKVTLDGGVTCAMESTGVTCTNAQGHGFVLARDSHKEF